MIDTMVTHPLARGPGVRLLGVRRRHGLAVGILLWTVAPFVAPAQDTTYHPVELKGYFLGLVSPRGVIRSLALAGFDQWRGRPVAFPRNWRGFEDRLGSRFGQVAISHTLRFGTSRMFDERTIRYQPCACGDSASRLAYAVLGPLRVNSPTGVHLSALNPTAEITSGVLVTGVRSGGLHVGEGLRAGVSGLAVESLANIVREFWPWKWRPPFL